MIFEKYSETQLDELIKIYRRQMKTCDEAIEALMHRREEGKISDKEYYSKIGAWVEREAEVRGEYSRIIRGKSDPKNQP